MSKLNAQYNEYGYVIFKNSRAIYAAGNSPYESQAYVGSRHSGYKGAAKDAIPEGASVLSLEAIAIDCKTTLASMCDRPDLYKLKGEYEEGSAKFSSSLNPLEQAYKCGALSRWLAAISVITSEYADFKTVERYTNLAISPK